MRKGNSGQARPSWVELVKRIYPDDADHIIAYLRPSHPAPRDQDQPRATSLGSTGIGKNTMLEPLKRGVGEWNFKEVSPQDIMGRYNDYMHSVVLRISEVHDLGEVSRYAFHDRMKTPQAAPPDVVRVNGKYCLRLRGQRDRGDQD